MKINKNLLDKLERIEQEIRISSLDTTIIASFFFLVALYLTLIGLGAIKSLLQIHPLFVIIFFYAFIPIISILFSSFNYILSIIYPKDRFLNKARSLSYVWATTIFVIEICILLLSTLIFPIINKMPELIIYFILAIFATIAFLIYFKIRDKLMEYFKKEYSKIPN